MKKTTKLHKYAIMWLHNQGYTVEDIAKEIKLSIGQIEKVLATFQSSTKTDTTNNDQKDTANKSRTKNLMITDSNAKKFKVAIMTKDASMLNDELKNKTSPNKNTQSYIYRPDHE